MENSVLREEQMTNLTTIGAGTKDGKWNPLTVALPLHHGQKSAVILERSRA